MRTMYLRFGAMILTGMVVMSAVMLVGTYDWSHIRYSESRVFMALTMGGAMGLVMIAWMLSMYRSVRANIGVVAASLLLLVGGAFLDRSQTTVQDIGFMSGMIPHHSLAITRSERAERADVRVCRLAVEISEARVRLTSRMDGSNERRAGPPTRRRPAKPGEQTPRLSAVDPPQSRGVEWPGESIPRPAAVTTPQAARAARQRRPSRQGLDPSRPAC